MKKVPEKLRHDPTFFEVVCKMNETLVYLEEHEKTCHPHEHYFSRFTKFKGKDFAACDCGELGPVEKLICCQECMPTLNTQEECLRRGECICHHSKAPVEEKYVPPSCAKCNYSFLSHHKVNLYQEDGKFYHTGCIPKPPQETDDWEKFDEVLWESLKDQSKEEYIKNFINSFGEKKYHEGKLAGMDRAIELIKSSETI